MIAILGRALTMDGAAGRVFNVGSGVKRIVREAAEVLWQIAVDRIEGMSCDLVGRGLSA